MLTPLHRHRILIEGVVVGLIGATSVAAWFFFVDLAEGRPFFTPAVIGSAMFFGLRDPSTLTVTSQPVLLYSAVHLFAFLFVGIVASLLVAEAEKAQPVMWLLVEFFIVFEFGFYAVVALLLTPVLDVLAWVNVAAGNLVAAIGMGYFLWRARPGLREMLRHGD